MLPSASFRAHVKYSLSYRISLESLRIAPGRHAVKSTLVDRPKKSHLLVARRHVRPFVSGAEHEDASKKMDQEAAAAAAVECWRSSATQRAAVPDERILGLMWCSRRITGFSFVLVSAAMSSTSRRSASHVRRRRGTARSRCRAQGLF